MGSNVFKCGLILCACLSSHVHAEPLSIRNLNPFLAGYELPPALVDDTDAAHRTDLNLSYAVSNASLEQQSTDEHLIADGEVRRWQFTLTQMINSHWNIQADVPYQSVSGGSLDGFIENFHREFNLPNGNRASWPRNRLLIDYSNAGQSLYYLNSSQSGMGDLALRSEWQFDKHASHATALWFTVKLPTGDADKLTGSGTTDLAATLSAAQQMNDRLESFEQVSFSWLSQGKRLHDEQKHSAASGTLGVDWSMTHSIAFVAQLDAHSAIFSSDTRLLGPSLQLSFGPRYRSMHWQTSLCISEDLAVDTAPDVQFQFNLARRF